MQLCCNRTMVLIWIGIAAGILIAFLLVLKITKTKPHEGFALGPYCKKCGYKTNGLKCPYCSKK